MVGKMGWFAMSWRGEVAHAVNRLQQFKSIPTKGALNAALRVASYIASNANFRIGGGRLEGVLTVWSTIQTVIM